MNRRNIEDMFSKTWVKIVTIILAVLVVLGMGFLGVNAFIKNTSRSATTSESAKESSEKKEEDLTWDKKLIVLMDNQKASIAITTQELRDGEYLSSGSAGPSVPATVSKITAEALHSSDLDEAVSAKKAELFKVLPYYRGAGTYLLVEPKKTTLFGSQNFNGSTLDTVITDSKLSVTMTNEEMKTYYDKHEKELAPLVEKIHVDSKNKNANSAKKSTSEKKQESTVEKKEQAKPEKKASDLSLKEQQALALLALPAKMYSNFGDITTDMILAGTSPANGSTVDNIEEVSFGGIKPTPELDKYMIHLADVNVPGQPPYYVIGSFKIDGDTITYKTQGTRVMASPKEEKEFAAQGITDLNEIQKMAADRRATVTGTESLQALYEKYKDNPKFEQMKSKVQ